jgi:hypothetical protein
MPTTLIEDLAVDTFLAEVDPLLVVWIEARTCHKVVITFIEEMVIEDLFDTEQSVFTEVGHRLLLVSNYVL